MRVLLLISLLASLVTSAAQADGERAGQFDYYVLALSWSPNWCELEGDARNAEQCESDLGWSLHGLWPQYHRGWPSFCPTAQRPPSRAMTRNMVDIMGSSGLAWYQWKKHGRCTDLPADTYYDLSRRAFESIAKPGVFRKLKEPVKLPASVVEDAFVKANPELKRDMITVTCRQHHIQEVRICLSRDLEPVPCGRGTSKDCSLKDAHFSAIR
ncbi:Ribonuclease I precursor [Roseovarius albus]|uniref:Ribonuclease I n=1 Tax=Roseovarius albus TaxID=1247867 RepID=A0A1X6YML4_9RHOB|nr:ribonuclease T2 [Roseovarius albus]SLN24020.1 Ribonuclease I precursor [Roseovarius albus]